jgi:hypothetical protein
LTQFPELKTEQVERALKDIEDDDNAVTSLRKRKGLLRSLKAQIPGLVHKLQKPAPTNTICLTVEELLRNVDGMSDAQCLHAVETLLTHNPTLMNEAMKTFLQELEALGTVINLPAPRQKVEA